MNEDSVYESGIDIVYRMCSIQKKCALLLRCDSVCNLNLSISIRTIFTKMPIHHKRETRDAMKEWWRLTANKSKRNIQIVTTSHTHNSWISHVSRKSLTIDRYVCQFHSEIWRDKIIEYADQSHESWYCDENQCYHVQGDIEEGAKNLDERSYWLRE